MEQLFTQISRLIAEISLEDAIPKAGLLLTMFFALSPIPLFVKALTKDR
jgi:hypothetical protein